MSPVTKNPPPPALTCPLIDVRRKKKGCDLNKPTCGQCARLNIACGWDEKKWTFVNQEASSSTSTLTVRSRSADALRRRPSPSPPTGSQEQSLSRTAFEINAEGEFWTNYYPRDDPETKYIAGMQTVPWTRTLRDIAAFDPTTRLALNALSTNIVGRSRSDSALLQESTRLYAEALRETNRALQDPVRAQSDAMLACCKILSMYENFRIDQTGTISSQGEDWHKHVEGTCRIVELRGPEKHVSHHGHSLFEDARTLAVISGITRRRPNFFTQPAWHTIPWKASPRNIQAKLVDIMITLPGLLRSHDQLAQRLSQLNSDRDRFAALTDGQNHINRCIRIGESLREWEQDTLLECMEQSSTRTQNYAGPLTILEVCKNHGYGFFHVCMHFYVSCLLLYATTWVSYRTIALAVRPDQLPNLPAWMRLPDIPEWMNPRVMAANLVTCVPHYFEPDAGFWGAHAASFAVGSAMHYYAATGGLHSEEMNQLKRLFNEAKLGGVTSNFFKSIANTADTAKGDLTKPEEHRKMAISWYGMDALQRDRTPSSSS